MKKIRIALIFIYVLGCTFTASAQFKPHYVNMTEVGGLFGRVVYDIPWSVPAQQQVENRLSLTLQTFNGVQLKPRMAVGLTTGLDWYQSALLMPIAAGIRYDLAKSKNNVTLLGMLDAGYGFQWLHADATGYKTDGGMMISPGLGLKFGLKSGSALLLSLGYKRQHAKATEPLGWGEIEKWENRVYNRMAVRFGFVF